jgi:FixJ family two-component response regulator
VEKSSVTKSKPTILAVDDEPNVLKSLKRLLFDTDYKVLTAASGEEALAMFDEADIHLVISDYRMPGMNGVEFLSQVKKLYPETIRIVLSGYADVHAIVEAINDGEVYKFIAKPWNDQDLLTTLMRAFEQHSLQRENARLYEELRRRNHELEDLAKSLEERVAERTRDLEMKNRALNIAHSILDLLPAGVIGVDSNELVVYFNDIACACYGEAGLGLGVSARPAFGDVATEELRHVMTGGVCRLVRIGRQRSFESLCQPLPGGAGVILLIRDHIDRGEPTTDKRSDHSDSKLERCSS